MTNKELGIRLSDCVIEHFSSQNVLTDDEKAILGIAENTKKQLEINDNKFSDIEKEWLISLYENEIQESIKTIDNERIWSEGSPDSETAFMHKHNIELQKLYIEKLRSLINDFEK